MKIENQTNFVFISQERKHFATSIKARSSQPWCTRSSVEGKPSQELKGSQGERRKAAPQVSNCKPTDTVAPSSATQTHHHEDALWRDLKETETFVTRDENPRTETKTGKGKKKQLGNGSNKKLGPKRDTQRDRDPHTDVLHEDGQSSSGNAECSHGRQKLPQSDVNDAVCLKKRKKKESRGRRESVEKGAEQSQAETEGEPEEQLPSLLEDLIMTTVPHSEPEKKKPAAAGRQDQSAQSVEEASGVSSQADWKKKKYVDVESRNANKTAEPPADKVNVQRKRDVNEPSELSQTPAERPGEVGADFEETEAPQDTLGLSFTKRKKKKKNQKELPDSSDKDVNFSNGVVTNADLTVKKKKKKMVDVSHTAEEDETQTEEQEAEVRTKKKKKLKQSWSCEDTTAPAENSVFVRKKKKKGSSFLPADEEENGAEEERSLLQSEAEKPDVSANGLAATSEEFPESSSESKNRVKKKKKRRSAEQDCVKGETDWEEPKETAEAEVKKKKKRKRKDGETMSPTEKYVDEPQAEVDIPLKKKKKKKKIPAAASEDAESELSLNSANKLKKKKAADKLSLQNKPFSKTADSEARKTQQQPGRTEPDFNFSSASETSRVKQKKKKRLHQPNQDFLSHL